MKILFFGKESDTALAQALITESVKSVRQWSSIDFKARCLPMVSSSFGSNAACNRHALLSLLPHCVSGQGLASDFDAGNVVK